MSDRLDDTLQILIQKLQSKYPSQTIDGELQFRNDSGCGFCVSGHRWNSGDLIILECGDKRDSPRSIWEDVDTYYLDDMTVEDICNEIVKAVDE